MKSSSLLLLLGLFTGQVMAKESVADRYPGPWEDEYHQAITTTLTVNRIAGCGQYKYREDVRQSQEYLVYCTRDGKRWLAYLVWPRLEKVLGPYTPDPSLN